MVEKDSSGIRGLLVARLRSTYPIINNNTSANNHNINERELDTETEVSRLCCHDNKRIDKRQEMWRKWREWRKCKEWGKSKEWWKCEERQEWGKCEEHEDCCEC